MATSSRLAVACVGIAIGVWARAQSYNLTDLGFVVGNQSWSAGLSETGVAVGYCVVPSSGGRAFTYSNGSMTQLPNPFGANESSAAYGVNSGGQIVGFCSNPNQTFGATAMMWSGNSTTNLQMQGYTDSWATEINESGMAVGYQMSLASGLHTAFSYLNGSFTLYTPLAGDVLSRAYGVNNEGTVVGNSDSDAVYWDAAGIHNIGGYAGNSEAAATAINASGLIVGQTWNAGFGPFDYKGAHAFVYNGASLSVIAEAHDGGANDVNDAGVIVGTYNWTYSSQEHGSLGTERAFSYSNGAFTDLTSALADNSLGWRIRTATAINNQGTIFATAVRPGATRAVLLTPVPEPLTCVGLGLPILFMLKRRKKIAR